VSIAHGGRIVYEKAFGFRDGGTPDRFIAKDQNYYGMPFGRPTSARAKADVRTIYAIGSVTKQFTAAAILLLAQRGALTLSDRLAMYFPDIPNSDAITLRMMLNQTSGLHTYPRMTEHAWPTTGPIALATIVSILATDPSDFAPGTKWEYSNANYALLAAVITKVAGTTDVAEFFSANIFEPLAMRASDYGFTAQQQPDLAQPYTGTRTFTLQEPVSLDLAAGAGGIVSSALDVAAWDIALMNEVLLDPRSMSELWTPGKLTDGTLVPYAMGFVPTTLAGHREVWHNGLTPGAGGYCYNAIFPDDKLAVVVLSNGADFQAVPERIVTQVLAAYDPASAMRSAPPTPVPGEDPAVTARAKDWLHRLQTGTVDLSQVDDVFAQKLTPDFLAQIQAGLANAGAPTDWRYLGTQNVPGAVISTYRIRLGDEQRIWSIGLTPDGKIAGSLLG
jgi:CubicO group peptidase (beta-lactamase class C family)